MAVLGLYIIKCYQIEYPTSAQYKKEYEWLKEVDSLALANAQMNLDKAYKNSDVKNLALRNWTCPSCGANHDRDIKLLKLSM